MEVVMLLVLTLVVVVLAACVPQRREAMSNA